jgi:hypothetical protein
MTPLREELARAICEKDCARLRIGLPPCVDERGINAPCRGNQMQREVNYGRFADAALAILTREIAAARKAALEEAAKVAIGKRPPVNFDSGIMRLGYLSAGNDIAAAIRKLGEG